jgi:SsrA-binding protein
MILLGSEVKSLREKKLNLKDSFVSIKDGKVWLIGAHIS